MTGALWLHVAAASWWILGCATMAMAGTVVKADSAEERDFLLRVVPRINQANIAAAAFLLATGVVNIYSAGARRQFHFSTAFSRILGVKLGLYAIMVGALAALLHAERKWRRANARGSAIDSAGRLVALSAVIALCGAAAMMLGVWLAGE